MSVADRNRIYQKFCKQWQKCRDVIAGESEVKAHGEIYLPKPSGMNEHDYAAYKLRAQFTNYAGRTLYGLDGMCNRKPLFYEVPKSLEQYLENVDGKGHTLVQFVQNVIKDVLITNWGGFLVDMPQVAGVQSQLEYELNESYPYIVFYKAEDIINWQWNTVGRQQKLKYVIFKEDIDVEIAEYTTETKTFYRVCEIDSTGYYRQTLYNDGLEILFQVYPEVSGKKFTEIPFSFVFGSEPTNSMLEDLINTNLAHYWKSADLNNGGHWTGVPTPWVQGADPETEVIDGVEYAKPMRLGGTQVQYLPAGASMHYLEFGGQGCNLLREMISDDEERMAILGARIISNEKKGVEAAETARIHRAGENSVLAAFAINLSNTLENIVKTYLQCCTGTQIKSEDVIIRINTDYDVSRLSAAELTALVSLWQSSGISKKVMFDNLKEGEIIDAHTSFEDMQSDIEEEQVARIQPITEGIM